MANRQFRSEFRFGFEAMPVSLFAKVTFGASGAPTLSNAGGVKSITRNSAGDYSILLQDNYNRLMHLKHVYDETGNAGTAPAAPGMFIKSNTVTSLSAPTLRVVLNSAGTPTDPASGEVILLEIVLSNSSVTN